MSEPPDRTSEIAARYRRRADVFERVAAGVRPEQWADPSPCARWDARDVVRHVVDMHGVMLRPLGLSLPTGPSVDDDPLAALAAARAAVEALLDDRELAQTRHDSPMGPTTAADHVDRVVSEDLVIHAWDLAAATGQPHDIDPAEVERLWTAMQTLSPELAAQFRTPGAFGPGIEVWGPEVAVPADGSMQDRLLGLHGRDAAAWRPVSG